jgi:hypothetical protein
MLRRLDLTRPSVLVALAILRAAAAMAQTAGPAEWQNDLTPIGASDWNNGFAAHLIERAIAHHTFPHETTTDQWFTESQTESYRALGQLTVESVCGGRQRNRRIEDLPVFAIGKKA